MTTPSTAPLTSFVSKSIRLVVPANKAKPSPQIGQSLGSIGLNMMKFCKEFNAQSVKYKDDLPMRVKLKSYADGNSSFTIHLPQTSHFLKKAANIPIGAHETSHNIVGAVHVKQIYEIAKLKTADSDELKGTPVWSVFRMIIHQCKSMGIFVDFSTDVDMEVRRQNQIFRDEQTRRKLKAFAEDDAKY